MKKYKKHILAALCIVAVLCAGVRYFAPERTIVAVGECNEKIQRNKFAITLNITVLDKNAVASIQSVQSAADEIVRHVKKIDDNTIEIQTKNISSYEEVKWEKNTQVILGIKSSIDLEIMTKNKDTIPAILGNMPMPGSAKVLPQRMINFSSRSVIDEAMSKCLQAAMNDARAKANAIAEADGEKLGRLVFARFGTSLGDDNGLFRARAFSSRANVVMEASDTGGFGHDYVQSSDSELSVKVETVFKIK
ncbi:MAG: SIMPL domain-containing protein [Rickettsiales bacterium]|nr:SIMPL domain-containing protein [Rickettsiales bacterium]